MQWLFLSIAIISEVIATSALKSSNGFTQLWPSLVVIAGYAAAFFLPYAQSPLESPTLSGLAPVSCLSRLLPSSLSGKRLMVSLCSDWRLSSLA